MTASSMPRSWLSQLGVWRAWRSLLHPMHSVSPAVRTGACGQTRLDHAPGPQSTRAVAVNSNMSSGLEVTGRVGIHSTPAFASHFKYHVNDGLSQRPGLLVDSESVLETHLQFFLAEVREDPSGMEAYERRTNARLSFAGTTPAMSQAPQGGQNGARRTRAQGSDARLC